MEKVQRAIGVIECWPCSVWAWCDRPVYHPAPECPEHTLDGWEHHQRSPEVRAENGAAMTVGSCLRGLPDDFPLTRYWRKRRKIVQGRHKRWCLQKGWPPTEPGFGIVVEKGIAEEMLRDIAARNAQFERARQLGADVYCPLHDCDASTCVAQHPAAE